ncbi:hypothetical protein ACFL3S_00180 [Gemmatimonadota bacterium]
MSAWPETWLGFLRPKAYPCESTRAGAIAILESVGFQIKGHHKPEVLLAENPTIRAF